jgi:hypothetical protein
MGGVYACLPLPFLDRENKNHAPMVARMTTNATPIPMPAVAPFDNELEVFALLDRADEADWVAEEVLDGVVLAATVMPEDDESEVATARILKPFTCIP